MDEHDTRRAKIEEERSLRGEEKRKSWEIPKLTQREDHERSLNLVEKKVLRWHR